MAIKRLATPLESIEYLLEEIDKIKQGGGVVNSVNGKDGEVILKSGDIHITTDTTDTKTVQTELERLDERIDDIGGGGSEYELLYGNEILIEYETSDEITYTVYFDIPTLRDKNKPITDYFMTLTDLQNYVNNNHPLLKTFGIFEEESTEIVYAVWDVIANSVDDQPFVKFKYFVGGGFSTMGRTANAYVWLIEQILTDENGGNYNNLIIEGGQ